MGLDAKQKVLIAIYTEYQKDMPEMDNISSESLGLGEEIFRMALVKLDNEGLVNDLKFAFGGDAGVPLAVALDYAKMSPYGIKYVEEKLNISPGLSGEEKVKSVIVKTAEWGWEQAKDFAARVLAEMIKT